MVHIFHFDPGAGAQFARSFALYDHVPVNELLFYYDPEDDCTNFVSQCVWAAYGGWIAGYTDDVVAKNVQRIKKDIRQVKDVWYGSQRNIGSNKWCRVQELYTYVTENKGKGPMARLVTEGKFTGVDPSAIRVGDVIQMVVASYTPQRYGHSLYVTKTGAKWEDVLICCHSIDRLDAPMSLFTQFPDNYIRLRVLRFDSAMFDE